LMADRSERYESVAPFRAALAAVKA